MQINNRELIVLIEALKSTTAYQGSRAYIAKNEGKKYDTCQTTKNKNDLVFHLTDMLENIAEQEGNRPSNEYYDLDCLVKESKRVEVIFPNNPNFDFTAL